jgi:hypothetical protein
LSGYCEHGDEPAGSGAMELVILFLPNRDFPTCLLDLHFVDHLEMVLILLKVRKLHADGVQLCFFPQQCLSSFSVFLLHTFPFDFSIYQNLYHKAKSCAPS